MTAKGKTLVKVGPVVSGVNEVSGETVEVDNAMAQSLIAAGYAVDVSSLSKREAAEGSEHKPTEHRTSKR